MKFMKKKILKIRKYHVLKILDIYADPVLKGIKTFEIRINDRDFQVGNAITFEVIDGTGRLFEHPLNDIHYEIVYMTDYAQKENYVVLGIKPLE